MGMNSSDDKVRIACKNFFIESLENKEKLHMSLESVGMCDDIVWGYEREVQDSYYPFMDKLHTVMDVERIAYGEEDILGINSNSNLSITDILTINQSLKGILYTLNKKILSSDKENIMSPEMSNEELVFPDGLEEDYQTSLVLRYK